MAFGFKITKRFHTLFDAASGKNVTRDEHNYDRSITSIGALKVRVPRKFSCPEMVTPTPTSAPQSTMCGTTGANSLLNPNSFGSKKEMVANGWTFSPDSGRCLWGHGDAFCRTAGCEMVFRGKAYCGFQ